MKSKITIFIISLFACISFANAQTKPLQKPNAPEAKVEAKQNVAQNLPPVLTANYQRAGLQFHHPQPTAVALQHASVQIDKAINELALKIAKLSVAKIDTQEKLNKTTIALEKAHLTMKNLLELKKYEAAYQRRRIG